MRRLIVAFVITLFVAQAGPARAGAPAIEKVAEVLIVAQRALEAGRPTVALDKLDRLKPDTLQGRVRAAVQLQRAMAFLMLNRRADMQTAFQAARRATPSEVMPLSVQWNIAASVADRPLAVDALDTMIDGFPANARDIDSEQIWPLLRGLRAKSDTTAADRLTLRLAAIGYGADSFVDRDAMAVAAIDIMLTRSDVDGAKALVQNVVDRQFLIALLTRKKYARLWSSIEARVEDGMRLPLVQAVMSSENWFQREPNSIAARRTLINAYQNAGRNVDADRTASAFAQTPEEIATIDEAGAWLVNDHGITLLALGRPEASDARMAALAVIDIKKSPWLISMLINRAEFLVRSGRYGQAELLFADLTTHAKQYGSPYAIQLVRRLKACAAHKQGTSSAAALIDDMIAHTKDARGATAEGLICLGRRDEAAALAVEALSDPDQADGMIDTVLPPLPSRDPSSWGAAELYTYPGVRAAIDKLVRPLPHRLVVKEPVD